MDIFCSKAIAILVMYAIWFDYDYARHIELAGVSMLQNVNKVQHFEAFFNYFRSRKGLELTRVCLMNWHN